MRLFDFFCLDNLESKVILFCYSEIDNNIKFIIEKYAEIYNRKILFGNNFDEKELVDKNIIITKSFDFKKLEKYNVKIFILLSFEELENSKKKIFESKINHIFLDHKIKYGLIKNIHDNYIRNSCNFIDFLNDCAHVKENDYIIVHTKYQSYFPYSTSLSVSLPVQ